MSSRKHPSGFSLVEVLVAAALLSVAIVGLVQGIVTALRSSKDSEQLTTASYLAAGQIELLRADGWIQEGVSEGKGGGTLSSYQWTQTVSPTSTEGLFEVVVEVRHDSARTSILELRTLLFDPPTSSTTNRVENSRSSSSRERSRKERR